MQASKFTDLHDIFEQVKAVWGDQLEGKTFCVRAKRHGKHEFSSLEIERYVGGGLNQHCVSNGVRLKEPGCEDQPRDRWRGALHRQRHPPGG